MLVAKQQTTGVGYEVTWRSLHPHERADIASKRLATAQADVPTRRRRVRRTSSPRLGMLLRVSLAAVCVVGLMLGYLAQRAVHTELLYERQSLQSLEETLSAQMERLELEADRLASLERVASVAKGHLGMQEPEALARIPIQRLDGTTSKAIRTAMGVAPLPPHLAGGKATDANETGVLSAATRVAWNRVSHWFSEWAGISMAEARGNSGS